MRRSGADTPANDYTFNVAQRRAAGGTVPLSYSQFIWGFEVFDSAGPGHLQNNKVEFDRGGAKTATLVAGVYTVDEFALHVQAQMRAADSGGPAYRCTFDYATLKFTIDSNGGANFSLNFGTQTATSAAHLLAFALATLTGGNQYTSSVAVGIAPDENATDMAGAWTALEPLVSTSPITAKGSPYKSELAQRLIRTIQHVSDGASVESIHVSTLRMVQLSFRALSPTEQTNMEKLLDWAVTGKRFTWQPNKASPDLLKLVLANPEHINNQFEWLTRSEAGYGTLSFYEQLS